MHRHTFFAFEVSLSVVRSLRPLVAGLRKRDKSLADQIQRAASSIAMNLAEGRKRTGLDQLHFYRIAAGSCAEVRAALQVGEAWGHLGPEQVAESNRLLDRQAALLFGLIRPRR